MCKSSLNCCFTHKDHHDEGGGQIAGGGGPSADEVVVRARDHVPRGVVKEMKQGATADEGRESNHGIEAGVLIRQIGSIDECMHWAVAAVKSTLMVVAPAATFRQL
jgi:hypothetical protein